MGGGSGCLNLQVLEVQGTGVPREVCEGAFLLLVIEGACHGKLHLHKKNPEEDLERKSPILEGGR